MSLPNDFHWSRVTTKLASAFSWRRGLVTRFPTDSLRNSRAAELLERLTSANPSDVDAEVWESITPHLECEYFTEALNLTNRSVGFRYRPDNINKYLAIVADFAEGLASPASTGGAQ
jgi:hypothetical protein